MAYSTLRAAIQAAIKQNDNEEITGNLLQSVLLSIVNTVGAGYNFAGVATPQTNPGTPDGAMFWIGGKGTYANFGSSVTIAAGYLGIFMWDGSAFTRSVLKLSGGEGVFDITDYTGNEYATLSAALAAVPQVAKAGGMEIRYVQSSDHNYVQYRFLLSGSFTAAQFTNAANWQGVDEKPTNGSKNLVESGGVYSSLNSPSSKDFAITDGNGYNILELNNGNIKTKNFDSENTIGTIDSVHNFAITDSENNNILEIDGGDIRTKNFDSSKLVKNNLPEGTLIMPINAIPVYITCNDLNKSNRWGINSRNKSVDIYLDHFFHTNKELGVRFNNGSTFATIYPKIVGTGTISWNNNQDKYEYNEDYIVCKDILKLKIRSVLNSATKDIFPKVLQIGDSITEGWFGNYPTVNGAPIQSWSWAKYYFEKDKQEYNSVYNSLFVGTESKNSVNYDNISYDAYAYGIGGKTAKWYCTNSDSAFYTANGFSLSYYLEKYKTLADDGITRLVPGSTAGTEVVDATAWDLCTPNIVVIQLGMNDTLSEWKTYIPQIVNSIKTEYPSMKIIISILDGCTCNYPSLYPNYNNIFFDDYNYCHTKLMEAYSYAIDNWQDEANGIYVLYSGMVMPMPLSCNVRECGKTFDDKKKRYVGVDSIERVPHPSRYGHEAIGYLLYSCIKWILLN